jgi:predicted metal-dependent hydrolase
MNHINLDKDKSYTLAEVVEFVQKTLEAVKEKSEHSDLQYTPTDVYWLLHDMLGYVNHNVTGEFALRRVEKGTYRVQYRTEEAQKQRAARKLEAEVRQTAEYLEKLTGRRPPWG